ncbi:hypothetical protein XENOCAPTIV_026808, partial [Xenoophorus captivus]
IATHVVTGILYGAKPFFVFDRDVSEEEHHQDIEGYLKLMINKIPSVSIGGSGSVKLEDTDVKKEVLSGENALCYVFTSLGVDEPYLTALSDYLKETPMDNSDDLHSLDVEKEQWYASKDVGDGMRTKAKLFSEFAEANKENKNTKFLIVALTDEDQEGSTIYLYKGGFTISENFKPPSRPETVFDTNHSRVTLKISPPRFGAENITSYSVEYCVHGEDAWKQTTARQTGEVTVTITTRDRGPKFS